MVSFFLISFLYLCPISQPPNNQRLTTMAAAATQAAPVPAHELVYQPGELPKLRSNYGAYLDEDTVGMMRETPIPTSMEEMRRRFEEDGYIWVKNVMPREDVFDMREAYFTHLAPTGILKPGTSPRDGIFDDREDPIVHNGVGGTDLPEAIERVKRLEEVHTLPFYLAFLEHQKLRGFIKTFMGWKNDVLIKRTMLRSDPPPYTRDDLDSNGTADTTFPMDSRLVSTTTRFSCVRARPNS